MLYGYVKQAGDTFEFIGDSGVKHENVVYGKQFLDASDKEFLSSLGVFRTVLLPVPENALDTTGEYLFNLREDGVVEYRPVYTVGVRVPESITILQARKVLRRSGLFDVVNSAILASTDDELKDEWEYALEVRRDWDNLITMSTSLGISSTQLDELFILGSTL